MHIGDLPNFPFTKTDPLIVTWSKPRRRVRNGRTVGHVAVAMISV